MSTATSPTSTSASTWHFPGPSTRFHQRERPPASAHARVKSAYTSVGPVLSTELRASRHHKTKSSVSSASSPSEYARSPLSRYSSYHHTMAASHHNATLPCTPAKSHRRSSSVQNSPFSDYFSDLDARSVDSNAPSSETKQLLVRMNKLQSQLIRDSNSNAGLDAIRIVGAKLDELEREFGTLHAQMNAPSFAGEDSGIFSDEEEGESKHVDTEGRTVAEPCLDPANDSLEIPPQPTTIAEFQAERDWFILRTQELLDGLRFTQSELSKRFTEVRQLNEEHNAQMEERDTLIEQLRSENEGLRSDLGFEYSELLFLKLQMKSLEVDVDTIEYQEHPAMDLSKERDLKKNRILEEMDRWRSDWQDVKSRFKRRRSRYGVSPDRQDSLSVDGGTAPPSGETEWSLETVKEGHGRVSSLTIKRMDSNYSASVTGASGMADTTEPLQIEPYTTSGAEDQQVMNDLEGHTPQGPGSEPQIASSSSQHIYVEHGTQTEHHHCPPTSQDDENEDRLFPLEQNESKEEEGKEGEDCAITTSSEASDFEDDYDDATETEEKETATPVPATPTKTAWQELWESLQNLTGIDDRFED